MKLTNKKIGILVGAMLTYSACFAAPVDSNIYKDASVNSGSSASIMNGISFESINGFWDKWHHVTVRYRVDNEQIRYTYANDIAWKVIQDAKNKGLGDPLDYPDGAMFGKVANTAAQDPLFTSSLYPKHVLRYQIMVRDSKKYASTRGWGYAIFDGDGKSTLSEFSKPKTEKEVIAACAECHEKAATRGYVFLGTTDFSPKSVEPSKIPPKQPNIVISTAYDEKNKLNFKTGNIEKFDGVLDAFLNHKIDVAILPHEKSFAGTFNEYVPTLIKHFMESNNTTILIDSKYATWVAVHQDKQNSNCYFVKFKGEPFYAEMAGAFLENIQTKKICSKKKD